MSEFLWEGPTLTAGYRALGSPALYSPQEFERCLNVILDRGRIEKRGGYATYQVGGALVGGGAVNSLFATTSTSQRKLVATANTRIFGISTAGAITQLSAAAPNGARYDFAEFNNAGVLNVVGYTAAAPGHAFRWDSVAAAVTNLAGPGVACGIVASHSGRIWTAEGRNLYIGDLRKIDTFSPGSNQPLDDAEWYGKITKLVPIARNFLLVLCERGSYTLTGSDPGNISGVPNLHLKALADVGCPSTRAVVKIRDEVYLLGVENGVFGLYMTDGSDFMKLSGNLQDDLDRITPASASEAVAVQMDDHVLFGLPVDGAFTVGLMILMHRGVRGRPFATWSFADVPRCFARDPFDGSMFFGKEASADVSKYAPTAYNDAGVAVDSDVITGSFGAGPFPGILRNVEMHAEVFAGGSVAVSSGRDAEAVAAYKALPNSPVSTAAQAAFDGVAGGESYAWQGVSRVYLHPEAAEHAQAWRFRFRENSTNNFRLHRVRVKIDPKASLKS